MLACKDYSQSKEDRSYKLKKQDEGTPFSDTSYKMGYKKLISPDSSDCRSFREGRNFIVSLNDEPSIISQGTGLVFYLKTKKYKLWPCNLPKEFNKKGDTILVTADVYEVLGDESAWGKPTIIKTIKAKE